MKRRILTSKSILPQSFVAGPLHEVENFMYRSVYLSRRFRTRKIHVVRSL